MLDDVAIAVVCALVATVSIVWFGIAATPVLTAVPAAVVGTLVVRIPLYVRLSRRSPPGDEGPPLEP